MAVSDTILSTCRGQIANLPELATFRTALALHSGATASQRAAYWQACYGDNQAGLSPAYRLKKAIRDTVTAAVDSNTPPTDREAAIRTLAAEFVPEFAPPADPAQELAELNRLIAEDQLS